MTVEQRRHAVGNRIAAIRADRGFSLSELARRARIGKGSLSEIESGQRNPTLDTLYAVAGPLGVPLTALLDEDAGTEGSGEFLHAQILHVEHHPDGATTEVFWLRVRPGGVRTSPAHGAGVTENVHVVAGELDAGRLGAERHAGPGETLQWISDVEHTYHSAAGATAVLTIHSPRP
ncbi:helix-turn-helix domain-containing protein [Gordonia insulae]|uniref:HTH-type transcriptional regulator SutR n=1 Tax=Gordonia insulae TaxID=2420509 RepID=A0A3G8JND1_9ACTN|nr:helix-turn-helix transcriptional regulator [Gordonia insulae]AZG46125.1 HTH-type transcriptional regulator SutR [Gordonia insulae]